MVSDAPTASITCWSVGLARRLRNGVVVYDEDPIGPQVDVELDPIGPEFERAGERGDSVLRSLAGCPAMGDDLNGHQGISRGRNRFGYASERNGDLHLNTGRCRASHWCLDGSLQPAG
jgi:hypothetical protein